MYPGLHCLMQKASLAAQSPYHLKDHKQKWRKLLLTEQCHMESASRNMARSLEVPGATDQKAFIASPQDVFA